MATGRLQTRRAKGNRRWRRDRCVGGMAWTSLAAFWPREHRACHLDRLPAAVQGRKDSVPCQSGVCWPAVGGQCPRDGWIRRLFARRGAAGWTRLSRLSWHTIFRPPSFPLRGENTASEGPAPDVSEIFVMCDVDWELQSSHARPFITHRTAHEAPTGPQPTVQPTQATASHRQASVAALLEFSRC